MASPCRRTGLGYDETLAKHYSLWNPDFTEQPDRILEPYDRCQLYNLIERCQPIQHRIASQEDMELLHTKEHIEILKSSETMNEEELKQLSTKYDYIYFHNDSYANARLALGICLQLIDDIFHNKIENGFAIIRPPGHHASREEFNGYCYLNNAAITAHHALNNYGLKRILIVDWDVHHGQGIQRAFYNDPRVIYFSIHRYEYGKEWPNLRESDYDYIGEGEGQGYNINVPLNEAGCTNSDYLFIFFNVLLPIAYQFDPELIIVSAGYDCALGCPEGEMELTPLFFSHLINLLSPLAAGKMALLLEGGYCINSLSESVAISIKTLLGDVCPSLPQLLPPKESVVESVLNVIKVLRPFWSCLRYQRLLEPCQRARTHHLSRLPSESNSNHEVEEDEYPLIQDCYDKDPDTEIKINQLEAKLENIIKTTTLRTTQHKLGILSYFEEDCSSSCECKSSIESVLQKYDHKQRSLYIQGDIKNIKDDVIQLVDKTLQNEIQSALALLSISNETKTADIQNLVSMVTTYSRTQHNINRILIINFNAQFEGEIGDNTLCFNISTSDKNGGEDSAIRNSSCIDIVFNKSTLVNCDLIAAFYQIILPISYQFQPDIVLISAEFSHFLRTSVTSACWGTIIQLLRGLADGQLLLLIKDDLKQDEIQDCINHCLCVLLDDVCPSLGSLTPSQSGVETICNVVDHLTEDWKFLQYREAIPDIKIEDLERTARGQKNKERDKQTST